MNKSIFTRDDLVNQSLILLGYTNATAYDQAKKFVNILAKNEDKVLLAEEGRYLADKNSAFLPGPNKTTSLYLSGLSDDSEIQELEHVLNESFAHLNDLAQNSNSVQEVQSTEKQIDQFSQKLAKKYSLLIGYALYGLRSAEEKTFAILPEPVLHFIDNIYNHASYKITSSQLENLVAK